MSFQKKTTKGLVYTKCNAPMGWGATLESTNKLLKWSLFPLVQLGMMSLSYIINKSTTHLQNIGEDKILQGCIVDTNRPTPNLHTIQDQIIVLSADLSVVRLRKHKHSCVIQLYRFDFSAI